MRRALVTGGSGEIGGAICRHLARAGMHVIVHANRRPERAEAVADEIRNLGGSAETVQFDVTDSEGVRQSLDRLLAAGVIQVLVNNAGIHADAPLAGMTAPQWKTVLDVCLNGFFNVTQPLLLPMIRTRWGRVISISSISGLMGNRGQANYAAAKAGLHGATKSLAIELGSRGITANVVAPGVIAGKTAEDLFSPELLARLVPMTRMGTADEVAALVGFLVSDAASYISGQVIPVNGGMF